MNISTLSKFKTIAFNKTGYDPFIDFLKAYCILVVIFCHGFPYLNEIGYPIWGVQIPLFLLIQVFHCYKREPKKLNWKVISNRILLPFILVELCLFAILIASDSYVSCKTLIINGLIGGGYGPGSYYPWVYIQMAVLIPLMRPLCEKLSKVNSLIVFIFLSIAIEVTCSLTDLPDSIYRLLCLRYIFLIYLGYIWARDGIRLNALTIFLSMVSLIALVIFGYKEGNYEPFFYTTGWTTHRMPCYFWTSFAFTGILYKLFTTIKNNHINNCVKNLSNATYEIFLMQMAYYTVIHYSTFDFINNAYLQYLIWLMFAFIFSISSGILLRKIEKRYRRYPN